MHYRKTDAGVVDECHDTNCDLNADGGGLDCHECAKTLCIAGPGGYYDKCSAEAVDEMTCKDAI